MRPASHRRWLRQKARPQAAAGVGARESAALGPNDPPDMGPWSMMRKPGAGARNHPLLARQFERVVAADSSRQSSAMFIARLSARDGTRGRACPPRQGKRRPSGVSLSSIYFAGRWPCAARRDASRRRQPLQADFVVAGCSHLGGARDASDMDRRPGRRRIAVLDHVGSIRRRVYSPQGGRARFAVHGAFHVGFGTVRAVARLLVGRMA